MDERNDVDWLKQQLIELQSQLAFQEDTIQALNDIVTRQQRQIENLNEQQVQTRNQLDTLVEDSGQSTTQEPPPPHY